MQTISKRVGSCLVASFLLLSAFTLPAEAYPWVYNLYGGNSLHGGVSYGTVSLSHIYDGGRRGVRMTVTADESLLSPCDNFGIQRFGFNTTLASPPAGCPEGDADGDGISDCADNCVLHPNGPRSGTCTTGAVGAACLNHSDCGAEGFCSKAQEDTCPPPGNKYGNACECEGNFDRDQDVDGTDAFAFKEDFGRSGILTPCIDYLPCYGDFEEDGDVDGTDAKKFKEDFGRGADNDICPSFWTDISMTLPPGWKGTFGSYRYGECGRFQIDARGSGTSRVNPLVIDMYHRSGNLSYADFVVPNATGQFFSAHIADFTYEEGTKYQMNCQECVSGFFASPGCGSLTTTTSSVKTTSTTTSKPTSTTTSKPLTTTTSKPTSTTTVQPVTTSILTSTVLSTSTSVSTTSSSPPSSTTTSRPTTTTAEPTTTSTQVTTSVPPVCTGEIYKGGMCDLGLPIDDPVYNRPGRRGLALTCEEVVDFCICTDCLNLGPECLIWTIEPADPYLSISAISTCSARLTVGESCDQLEEIREYTVTVTDTCNGWTDSVVVELGRVTIDVPDISIQQGSGAYTVPIKLVNRYSHVRALAANICACDGGDDKMVCSGCTVDPNRALDFSCAVAEREDGCCSVILYATNPAALIVRGSGTILNVIYEPTEQFDGCSCLRPVDRQVSDRFNEAICTCQSPGEVCFKSCGDIYPRDCPGPNCAPCGDNMVDLYDVLEAIDIILGISTPTDCQIDHGDVPNGVPPYCGEPAGVPNCGSDGAIDIFDALVIIDTAQGRSNCCDYCLFRRIF